MKKKFIFVFATILLCCYSVFAQSGDGFIEIKPINPPPIKPPFGNFTPPYDTIPSNVPTSIEIEELIFECYQNSSHLSLSSNMDESVSVVVYEMLSGVKYTSTINMVAGEVYTISTPWGTGLYTIRLTLADGTILEGDFQIR